MASLTPPPNIILPAGYNGSSCGYCGPPGQRSSEPTFVSYGMYAPRMTPTLYQHLCDDGWRRSGTYAYKVDAAHVCCKHITIRLEVPRYTLRRSARKTMKRTIDELTAKQAPIEADGAAADMAAKRALEAVNQQQTPAEAAATAAHAAVWGKGRAKGRYTAAPSELDDFFKVIQGGSSTDDDHNPSASCKTTAPAPLKEVHKQRQRDSAQRRRDLRALKAAQTDTPANDEATYPQVAQLHSPPLLAGRTLHRRLQTRLVPAAFSEEKYALFRRYQSAVHHESQEKISSPDSFASFCCESPLSREIPGTDGDADLDLDDDADVLSSDRPIPYGSYHMEWYLQEINASETASTSATSAATTSSLGRLVAVGVLDILPQCLSSVYLFYDPGLASLQLGKISALREILLVRQLAERPEFKAAGEQLQYYYMGYYIHTATKMRYKAQYKPSELLDVQTRTWIDYKEVLPAVEQGVGYGFEAALRRIRAGERLEEQGKAAPTSNESNVNADPDLDLDPESAAADLRALLPTSEDADGAPRYTFPGTHLPPNSPLLAAPSLEENITVLTIARRFGLRVTVPMRLHQSPAWRNASETRRKRLADAVAMLGWDVGTQQVGFLLGN